MKTPNATENLLFKLSKTVLFFMVLGILSFTSKSQAAESLNAYDYVTTLCADGASMDELKQGLENLGAGLYDSVLDTPALLSRLSTLDPYTDKMRNVINSDSFRMGLYACYPDSEMKRNLLTVRVIMTSAGSYSVGMSIGFFAGLKLFSMVTKTLGLGTAGTLRYMGVSDKAIMGLGKVTKIAVIGAATLATAAVVTVEVSKAYQRYELAKQGNENKHDNLDEIYQLSNFSVEIMQLMESAKPEERKTLQDQLTRVNKLIQQRINMT